MACSDGPWNNPYPQHDSTRNILYSTFSERPNHLDPARSYSSNEIVFTGQIYEPPLQYHYLKRPYSLVPLAAEALPEPRYFDSGGQRLPLDAPVDQIASTVYELRIKSGVLYQPHPAFAKDAQGQPRYMNLTEEQIAGYKTLSDFEQTGTRELTASDYIYQIKRLAHPKIHSPILGLMSNYIVGLRDYAKTLQQQAQAHPEGARGIDLTTTPLAGVELVDRYTYRIKIMGKYPQFLYWLAMPFFAPVPEEAERFYSQPGMNENNITLDWYPVGTGPYMLAENNPNLRMVLQRNPNFHGETYPSDGMAEDHAAGLLEDAGKQLPFIDQVVFSLEKESIPSWNKFLQGYYDASGISSDSFDQAVQVGNQGEVALTEEMEEKGMRLVTAVATSSFYLGFNMLDPVIGGYSERARKLRQALAITVDYEEYISIFMNGRGVAAQGPLPPGIFGYREGEAGINRSVYKWINNRPRRRSLDEAKQLLVEAGYPNGQDAESGRPLIIYFDTTGGGPDDKARFNWWTKQFKKLDIQLVIRNTTYNRFQEKMRKGNAQIFTWGWNADYPDPENFLFLLHGPNGKVKHGGENAANYDNPEFNRLFERMKNMDNGPERQAMIDRMYELVREDGPWLWGLHPKNFSLHHRWVRNTKPNLMANNTLKFRAIDPQQRTMARSEWNQPRVWPLLLLLVVLVVGTIPAVATYRRRERQGGVRGGQR